MSLFFTKASVVVNKIVLACKQHTTIPKTLIDVIVSYGKCVFQTNMDSLSKSKIFFQRKSKTRVKIYDLIWFYLSVLIYNNTLIGSDKHFSERKIVNIQTYNYMFGSSKERSF